MIMYVIHVKLVCVKLGWNVTESSDSDPISEILFQIDFIKKKNQSKLDKHAQIDIQRIELAALRLREAIS